MSERPGLVEVGFSQVFGVCRGESDDRRGVVQRFFISFHGHEFARTVEIRLTQDRLIRRLETDQSGFGLQRLINPSELCQTRRWPSELQGIVTGSLAGALMFHLV